MFGRLKPRIEGKGAARAVAHRIARVIWLVLHQEVDYQEKGSALPNERTLLRNFRRRLKDFGNLGVDVRALLDQQLTITAQVFSRVHAAGLHATSFGPGSYVIILGTFVPAADRVFIVATILATAAPDPTSLVITYQGHAANALPITIAPLAPEFSGGGQGITGPNSPPVYAPGRRKGDAGLSGIRTFRHHCERAKRHHPADFLGLTGRRDHLLCRPGECVAGVNSNTASLPVGTAPAIGSVLSAASFGSSGTAAPGSIVSRSVNGITVLFGTTPAPIFALAASAGQVNVLVPDELPSNGTRRASSTTAIRWPSLAATLGVPVCSSSSGAVLPTGTVAPASGSPSYLPAATPTEPRSCSPASGRALRVCIRGDVGDGCHSVNGYGILQEKLAASSVLPVPL